MSNQTTSTASYEAHLTEDRRLVLLRALENSAQYSAPAVLLKRFCDRLGHVVSSDRIEQDLNWLREMGLVSLAAGEGVTVATLNVRGMDVATGRARVPGVAMPQPGA